MKTAWKLDHSSNNKLNGVHLALVASSNVLPVKAHPGSVSSKARAPWLGSANL